MFKHNTFTLVSPKLTDQGIMPNQYSLAGGNISPPLAWLGVPKGTKSFALTMVDVRVPWGKFGLPNPGFLPADLMVHWIVYDIPVSYCGLVEGASITDTAIKQLDNSCLEFGQDSPYWPFRYNYIGCAPPAGDKAHCYIFTLFALKVKALSIWPGSDTRYPAFVNTIADKVIGTSHMWVWFGIKQ